MAGNRPDNRRIVEAYGSDVHGNREGFHTAVRHLILRNIYSETDSSIAKVEYLRLLGDLPGYGESFPEIVEDINNLVVALEFVEDRDGNVHKLSVMDYIDSPQAPDGHMPGRCPKVELEVIGNHGKGLLDAIDRMVRENLDFTNDISAVLFPDADFNPIARKSLWYTAKKMFAEHQPGPFFTPPPVGEGRPQEPSLVEKIMAEMENGTAYTPNFKNQVRERIQNTLLFMYPLENTSDRLGRIVTNAIAALDHRPSLEFRGRDIERSGTWFARPKNRTYKLNDASEQRYLNAAWDLIKEAVCGKNSVVSHTLAFLINDDTRKLKEDVDQIRMGLYAYAYLALRRDKKYVANDGVFRCHDSPVNPGTGQYVRLNEEPSRALTAQFRGDYRFVLFGHTHEFQPYLRNNRLWLNVGSIGVHQRTGTVPTISFAIIDKNEQDLKRAYEPVIIARYDGYGETMRKKIAAGLL
jgi:hypothetical protein